ncbi:MAG: outer membrane beta-barrel protein [Chitinophagaceae bacterium]
MKKFLFLSALIMSAHVGYSQSEISAYYGVTFPTGIKGSASDIDVLYNQMAGLQYGYQFKLSSSIFVIPQIGISSSAYIMDGQFTKSISGTYTFENTPNNYSQNLVRISSVKLPVFIGCIMPSDSSSRHQVQLSAGPYIEYIFNSVQQYKIAGKKFKSDMPVQNTFQGGVMVDIGIVPKKLDKLSLSWHFGGFYQVTNYLSGVKSFKPLGCYIGVGFRF